MDSAVFKFNFNVEDDETMQERSITCNPTIERNNNEINLSNETNLSKPFSLKIPQSPSINKISEMKNNSKLWQYKDFNQYIIYYLNATNTLQVIKHVSQTLNTDIVRNEYEGGFKLWECAEDLLHYFIDNNNFIINYIENKRILELGCGHGLPGIFCLLYGKASMCAFQDYNEEVIEGLTIPNVIINNEGLLSKSKFYVGDWGNMSNDYNDEGFDLILMSDTIYSIESYPKIYNVIKKTLKKGGSVLMGAKSYYFGCGGSTKQFEEYIKQQEGSNVCIKRVKEIIDGLSNVREISLFTFN
ncbi:hypothetical protein ABK040_008168 [Willaertia magna]